MIISNNLEEFASGKKKFISTDIFSCDIDIQQLNTVVNYSLACMEKLMDPRIEPLGRLEKYRVVISLISNEKEEKSK
jgi:superfamily II DNA/RNA helicase